MHLHPQTYLLIYCVLKLSHLPTVSCKGTGKMTLWLSGEIEGISTRDVIRNVSGVEKQVSATIL